MGGKIHWYVFYDINFCVGVRVLLTREKLSAWIIEQHSQKRLYKLTNESMEGRLNSTMICKSYVILHELIKNPGSCSEFQFYQVDSLYSMYNTYKSYTPYLPT